MCQQDEELSNEPNAQWFLAAKQGNIPELEKQLAQSPSLLEAKDEDLGVSRKFVRATFQMTALLWATDAGNLDAARFLLQRGADLNAVDTEGNTALILGSVKLLYLWIFL